MSLDPRLLQARDLFNSQEYFECHDVLEEVWSEILGGDRTFYQGLIHAAVALHHFEGGNLGGARKMYQSTVAYLGPYAPSHLGFPVSGFLEAFERCFHELLALRSAEGAGVALRAEWIPQWNWEIGARESSGRE